MNPYITAKSTRRAVLKAGGGLLAVSALPRIAGAAESHSALGT